MPERDETRAPDEATDAPVTAAGAASKGMSPHDYRERTSWFFYGLGLSLQTFLWFLLFLALVVAIAVGGELTEFRYVGF